MASIEGTAVGELSVTLSRPNKTSLHGTARLKNVGGERITTSVDQIFIVAVDGKEVWPRVGRQAFGGDPLDPGESRSASFDATITGDARQMWVRVTGWTARISPGPPKAGSLEVSAAISDIPLAR